jgi:hypothetical protein
MTDFAQQFILGAASIILAPAGLPPQPGYRITLPENTAKDAIAGDFARVSADFTRAIRKVEKSVQLEFERLEVG